MACASHTHQPALAVATNASVALAVHVFGAMIEVCAVEWDMVGETR